MLQRFNLYPIYHRLCAVAAGCTCQSKRSANSLVVWELKLPILTQ